MPGYKDWLKKALSDLKMAKKGMSDDDDTLDCVAYHTHQCVEKALKGYFISKGEMIEKTHDLEYLLKLCCKEDFDFITLKNEAEKLNPFSTQSRYPDDRFSIDRQEAEAAIKMAKRVLDFVQMKIEKPDPNMKLF